LPTNSAQRSQRSAEKAKFTEGLQQLPTTRETPNPAIVNAQGATTTSLVDSPRSKPSTPTTSTPSTAFLTLIESTAISNAQAIAELSGAGAPAMERSSEDLAQENQISQHPAVMLANKISANFSADNILPRRTRRSAHAVALINTSSLR
jgi:hypothetical protein